MARSGFRNHPKFRRLVALCGVDEATAFGMIHFLWEAAYETPHAPVGDSDDVELVSGWTGEPGLWTSALVRAKLLDAVDGGCYEVHDLYDNAPDFVRKRIERQARRRSSQKSRTPSSGNENDVSPISNVEMSAVVRRNPEPLGQRQEVPDARRIGEEKRRAEKRSAEQRREDTPYSPHAGDGVVSSVVPEKFTAAVSAVVEHYQSYHPRAVIGEKERKLLVRRLREGFTPELLCLAIDGNHRSPFHCGKNDLGRKHHGFELIFRDASKVNSFIEAAGEKSVVTAKLAIGERSNDSSWF